MEYNLALRFLAGATAAGFGFEMLILALRSVARKFWTNINLKGTRSSIRVENQDTTISIILETTTLVVRALIVTK